MKILSFINLPWDHMMSHKKFGPDRFSRFDVYWIQTDKQTNRQTDRQAKFIYRCTVRTVHCARCARTRGVGEGPRCVHLYSLKSANPKFYPDPEP